MANATCSVNACERTAYCRGYCSMHYQRARRTGDAGDALARRLPDTEICSWGECEREHAQGGYCQLHYRRSQAGAYMDRMTYGQRRIGSCVIPECQAGIYANRMCNSHYSRCRMFSLSPVQLMQMLASGACEICGGHAKGKDANVDHDHSCCPKGRSCGECIRGLLCGPCNRGIGLLGDDPAVLLKAAMYLGLAL